MQRKRVAENAYLWESYPYYSLKEVIFIHYGKEIRDRLLSISSIIERECKYHLLFPGYIFALTLAKFPKIEDGTQEEFDEMFTDIINFIVTACRHISIKSTSDANDIAYEYVPDNIDKFKHILIDKCIMLPMYSEEIAEAAFNIYTDRKLNKNAPCGFVDSYSFIITCIQMALSKRYDRDFMGFIDYDYLIENNVGYEDFINLLINKSIDVVGAGYDFTVPDVVVGALIIYEDNIGIVISSCPLYVLAIFLEDGEIVCKQADTDLSIIVGIKQSSEVPDKKQRVIFKESPNFAFEIDWPYPKESVNGLSSIPILSVTHNKGDFIISPKNV